MKYKPGKPGGRLPLVRPAAAALAMQLPAMKACHRAATAIWAQGALACPPHNAAAALRKRRCRAAPLCNTACAHAAVASR